MIERRKGLAPRKKPIQRTRSLSRRRPKPAPVPYQVSPPLTSLQQYYKDRGQELRGFCAECGERLVLGSDLLTISAIAHILPKEIFKSVETHPLNFLELGPICACHSRWDKSWKSAASMKVAELAKERFRVFYPLIAPAERRKIPAFLMQSL